MSPKVFVPHLAERTSPTGAKVPVHDISSAASFGTLVSVLDSQDRPMFIANHMGKVRDVLSEFKDGDCLLAVGDPTVIAACAAVLGRRHSSIHMLKWDRQMEMYVKVEVRIYG